MSARLRKDYSDPEKAKEELCSFIDENFEKIADTRWTFQRGVRIVLEMK
jgi:hypothetical protein